MSFGIVKLAFGQTCILFDGRSIAEDASVWVVMGGGRAEVNCGTFHYFSPL